MQRRSSPFVLLVRWGVPLLFVLFGVAMLVLSHGTLSGVQDNASESNVFVTSLDRDSVLSTIGVGSIVLALMIVLLGWLLRLNASEADDRQKEEDGREYFLAHGHWPDEG